MRSTGPNQSTVVLQVIYIMVSTVGHLATGKAEMQEYNTGA